MYEARLRVLEFPADSAFLGGFTIWNNGHRFTMTMKPTGVRVTRGAAVAFSFTAVAFSFTAVGGFRAGVCRAPVTR